MKHIAIFTLVTYIQVVNQRLQSNQLLFIKSFTARQSVKINLIYCRFVIAFEADQLLHTTTY